MIRNCPLIQSHIDIWRSWIRASWYNYENNQQYALYVLIYYSSRLYMFRAMFSSIIRSNWLYLQYLVVYIRVAVGWCLEWTETQLE
jgi:hypothetical protein